MRVTLGVTPKVTFSHFRVPFHSWGVSGLLGGQQRHNSRLRVGICNRDSHRSLLSAVEVRFCPRTAVAGSLYGKEPTHYKRQIPCHVATHNYKVKYFRIVVWMYIKKLMVFLKINLGQNQHCNLHTKHRSANIRISNPHTKICTKVFKDPQIQTLHPSTASCCSSTQIGVY